MRILQLYFIDSTRICSNKNTSTIQYDVYQSVCQLYDPNVSIYDLMIKTSAISRYEIHWDIRQ